MPRVIQVPNPDVSTATGGLLKGRVVAAGVGLDRTGDFLEVAVVPFVDRAELEEPFPVIEAQPGLL